MEQNIKHIFAFYHKENGYTKMYVLSPDRIVLGEFLLTSDDLKELNIEVTNAVQ